MKTKIIIIIAVISIALLAVNASAEFWECFQRGERINFCGQSSDRTCGSSICYFCIDSYNEANFCYNQGNFNLCNAMPLQCADGNSGSTNIDSEPPVLEILHPENNGVYSEKSLDLIFNLDESAQVSILNNEDSRPRWKRICNRCTSYNKEYRFSEGLNNLTFMAEDVVGNDAFTEISFFVDTRNPRISRTEPRRGFASGSFNVQFSEENPLRLTLNYGNSVSGYLTKQLDISSECFEARRRKNCSTFVNLQSFDNQLIEYWFEIADIVGNEDTSRIQALDVDATFPLINSLEKDIDRRSVEFVIGITEENFDSVEFIDNLDDNPRWRRLCSSLRRGMCIKKVSFREGAHNLDIQVNDKAGNAVSQNIEFVI